LPVDGDCDHGWYRGRHLARLWDGFNHLVKLRGGHLVLDGRCATDQHGEQDDKQAGDEAQATDYASLFSVAG